jgi:hypothetical protein
MSGEVCEIPSVETHNAWIDWLAKEQYAKIGNDQLCRLEPKKTNLN